MLKILVCGGREFDNKAYIWEILDMIHAEEGIEMVLHGNARGADRIGGAWAKTMGLPEIKIDANWDSYPRGAGPIRNGWMLKYVPIDLIVAFPGGTGTEDMVKKGKAAGIPVERISHYE